MSSSTTKPIVLITGANQGLGYYSAQQFANTGKYHVIIGSRDLSKGQKAIQNIAADTNLPVNKADLDAVQIDVTDDASIEKAAKTIEEKYGRLDVVRALSSALLNGVFLLIVRFIASQQRRHSRCRRSHSRQTDARAIQSHLRHQRLRSSGCDGGVHAAAAQVDCRGRQAHRLCVVGAGIREHCCAEG